MVAEPSLACPFCQASLSTIPGDGFSETTCNGCRRTLSIARGKLLSTGSERTVIERATSRRAGSYIFSHVFSIYAHGSARMFVYRVRREGCGNILPKNAEVFFVHAVDGADGVRGYLLSALTGTRFDIPADATFETMTLTETSHAATTAVPALAVASRSAATSQVGAMAHNQRRLPERATRALPCPVCQKPFADPSDDGYVETVCGSCQTQFAVTTGPLSRPTSTRIVHQRQSTRRAGIYSWFHQFSVFIPGGFKSFSYTTPTPVGGVVFSEGDRVSVVCTRRDGQAQDLVYVYSHLLGQRIDVSSAGSRARRTALIGGCGVGFVVTFGLWVGPLSLTPALLFGASLGTLAGVLAWQLTKPQKSLTEGARRQAGERVRLLELKTQGVLRHDQLSREWAGAGERLHRLDDIEAKMRRVGEDLYKARLEKLRSMRAALIERQEQLSTLAHAYERFVDMIEVELESGGLEQSMSVEGTALVSSHLDEIQRLEAATTELRLEAEATDEVERLLQP